MDLLFKLFNLTRSTIITKPYLNVLNKRNYAKAAVAISSAGGASVGASVGGSKKKKLAKVGPIMEKKIMPVETDVNKLVNYLCGSNIYKTGEDIKLKSDSEYPNWLWSLNTDRIIPLEELDPNTKQYWRRLRKMALKRNNQLQKLKKF